MEGDPLIILWEQSDVHAIKRSILSFMRQKQNYLIYLGWFIGKMSLIQTLYYREFELNLNTLDYWLQDMIDDDNMIDWSRMLRAHIRIGLIFIFIEPIMSGEKSRLLKKAATEIMGTPRQLGNIFSNYQPNIYYIEVEDLTPQKNEVDYKLTYSIENYFRANVIYKAYQQAFYAIR